MDGIERARFDHIGVVTEEQHDGEMFVDATRVWVTSPRDHPFHVEYLRFEPDTHRHRARCAHEPHVAYRVADVDAAIEGHEVLLGPFDVGGRLLSGRIRDASTVRSWSSCSTRTPMRRGGSRCATRWRGTRTRSTPTAARRRSRASPRPATAASS